MSQLDLPGPIVSVSWLRARLDEPQLCIIDATWRPLGGDEDPRVDFEAQHLPGARFFDHRAVADPESQYTDTRPSPEHFAEVVAGAGIGKDDTVIVYSQKGTAGGVSRAWWLLRSFGHTRVAVLDGGLPAWLAAEGSTEAGPPAPLHRDFVARDRLELVRDVTTLRESLELDPPLILDARPPRLFAGEGIYAGGHNPKAPTPEPGRIPGSINLPSAALVDPDTKTLRPAPELRALLADRGADPRAPIVTTCSLGVGAATLALAMAVLGHDEVAIFDGAWEVWGSDPSTPKETG